MSYNAIPTLAGKERLAAALDGATPIVISEMVVGDGGGNPTTPLETQTQLVNLRDASPIESAVRESNKVTFSATLGVDQGGYVVREVGFVDEDGILLFIASYPATEKLLQEQNANDILTIAMTVVISGTANVVLQPPTESLVSIADMIRAPHITVDSATTTAPPAAPPADALYLVPVGATGAWAGNAHRLAQWNGTVWVFRGVPRTHLVGVADTDRFLKRTATGWVEIFLPVFRTSRAALLFYGSL